MSAVPSTLKKFDLSIESDGLIYVRGRVRNPNSPRKALSLVLLSLKSSICCLLVITLHRTLGHPSISVIMSVLAETYFITGLRNFLKKLSRECVACRRLQASSITPKMGLLPSSRITPAPPFSVTGVDFMGPFLIHRGNLRKPTRVKVYAAVFVCFTTRAVHLELCSDLSSEAFIAAFNRFCSRRGVPRSLYSDNGSNFVGTNREFDEVRALLQDDHSQQSLSPPTCNGTSLHTLEVFGKPP